MLGCQTDVTANAVSHLHPKWKQVKDPRPFEENVSDKAERPEESLNPELDWAEARKNGVCPHDFGP